MKHRSPYLGYAFVAIIISLVCNFSYLLLLVMNQTDTGNRRVNHNRHKNDITIVAEGVLSVNNDGFGYIVGEKGDSIFVYTDGVAEATDANNELFGTDRTIEALNAIPEGATQKEILAGVRAAVDACVKEAPQFDDLTMVGLKYNGPQDDAVTEEQA